MEQAKKLYKVFLRFLSILFLIFEKREKQKNCARFFLRFVNILFIIFEKRGKQKSWEAFLRFVNILFFKLFLIFEKGAK